MPTSDPREILLTHNRWATKNMLEACSILSEEQFHHRFEMGGGSLHDNLLHVLAAMRSWGDLLAGREQRARLDEDECRRSPQEMLSLLAEISDDLKAAACAHPVDEMVTASRGGRTYTFARGGVITHVTTHGMHHRAQCLNMLRQMGVEPLPPSAVVEWIVIADGGA